MRRKKVKEKQEIEKRGEEKEGDFDGGFENKKKIKHKSKKKKLKQGTKIVNRKNTTTLNIEGKEDYVRIEKKTRKGGE